MPGFNLNQPLFQITLSKEGAPDKILTLSPLSFLDHLTVVTLEHASRNPIEEGIFLTLAATLHTELTEQLRTEIYATIIGTTLMIVHKWYSPRRTVQLLENIKHDPLQAMVDNRGDTFAEFIIEFTTQQMMRTGRSDEVLDFHIAAIREVIPRGAPDEEARNIFFETLIVMAQKYVGDLALPPRDSRNKTTDTPLFAFADEMTDLVVDYGNARLAEKELAPGRFDGFARLDRKRLIRRLEIARKTISREISMSPSNSGK